MSKAKNLSTETYICPRCDGKGELSYLATNSPHSRKRYTINCYRCDGTGVIKYDIDNN